MLITFCLNTELLRGTGYCYIAVTVKGNVFSSFVLLKTNIIDCCTRKQMMLI